VAVAQLGTRPPRWTIYALALIGAGLIAAPFVFQMFDRAPKGAQMIAGFKPYMTSARLNGFPRDLREINAGVRESETLVVPYISGPPARTADARFDRRFPDFAAFERQWVGIDEDMTGMLTTIQANLGNYNAVAALPTFTLFPWFFVAPGVLILAVLGAARARPSWWRAIRWALVALGIGLIAAPVVFQMFSRAPKGERMVNAFKTIETTKRVETIQGYFGEMATGQGAIRLELVPALEHAGLGRSQIASSFPAVDTLDRQWIPILNDMTPMIGAMSDNVTNYDAVAALPPFGLFPWFFVIPGLLVAGLAAGAGRRRHTERSSTREFQPSIPQPKEHDDSSLYPAP
jgi:hypothetical protein